MAAATQMHRLEDAARACECSISANELLARGDAVSAQRWDDGFAAQSEAAQLDSMVRSTGRPYEQGSQLHAPAC